MVFHVMIVTQPISKTAMIISLIIGVIGMIVAFAWLYKENKQVDRIIKEAREYNKNAKDGIYKSIV